MNVITEDGQTVIGNNYIVEGNMCCVIGSFNIVNGDKCDVTGNDNIVNGNMCLVVGQNNLIHGESCNDYKRKKVKIQGKPSKAPAESEEKKKKSSKKLVKLPPLSKLDQDKEGDGCVICLDNAAKCIILPCGHKILCAKCSYALANEKTQKECTCPECRKKVKEIKWVYE